jgi:hypothetical protein
VTGEDLTQLKTEWKGIKIFGKDSMFQVPTDTLFKKTEK